MPLQLSLPSPSLDQLDAVVERLCCRPDTSGPRAKQLRWVAGELEKAVDRDWLPLSASESLQQLLSQRVVESYLEAARFGHLRRRAVDRPFVVSEASQAVRLDCLRIIAEEAEIDFEPPVVAKKQPLKPVVAARPRSILVNHLREQSIRPRQAASRIRLLAVLGIVMDTRARSGELCALRLGNLSPDLDHIQITRLPQHRGLDLKPRVETVELSGPARSALRAWLPVRQRLVDQAEGTTDVLLVSVHSSHVPDGHGGDERRPPGMPLQVRGLQRSYERAIVGLNVEMAGEPGWEPMPRRMEQLRRAIELEVIETDGEPRLRRAS